MTRVVSGEGSDAAREWAADKRDFVADVRDEDAETRQAAADVRDSIADAREAEHDEREQQLDARVGQLEALAQATAEAVARVSTTPNSAAARAARVDAREDRLELSLTRQDDTTRRDQATAGRLADGRPTLLALAFASIAEYLYRADSYDDVLARIVEATVATVAGSDAASVTLLAHNVYRTGGSTGSSANGVDQAQYDANEGPCLDAATTDVFVAAPSFPDERWPVLGTAPKDHGVHSSVSYPLKGFRPDVSGGSLNIYGFAPDAFDQEAVEVGTILAAHASLAARAVGERADLHRLDEDLKEALLARDVIGQAKGILMERLKATPEQAFDLLRSASQNLNRKLREVARQVSETGELPPVHPGQS